MLWSRKSRYGKNKNKCKNKTEMVNPILECFDQCIAQSKQTWYKKQTYNIQTDRPSPYRKSPRSHNKYTQQTSGESHRHNLNPLATGHFSVFFIFYFFIFFHQKYFFCPKKLFVIKKKIYIFGEKLLFWTQNYFWWKKNIYLFF